MKKSILLLLLIFPSLTLAQSLRSFLGTCAWGVVGGAAAGVISLALVDKPSESWNNVAKGASLGLYVGIGYGFYKMNQPAENFNKIQEPNFSWSPRFEQGEVSGVDVAAVLYRF